ncbi:MAG: cysteine synthase family protein, partial [Bacilli bacterium]
MKTIVGNTKLVRLINIEKKLGIDNQLYAKVENTNPTGSIKDRPVYYMLIQDQKKGLLKKGTTVIEATSGNTGIALSYFTKVFDYKAIIVMPSSMSLQRREMIARYGGELVLVDGGMAACHQKAEDLHREIHNSFVFGQFEDLHNPQSHYLTTGPEIIEQCPDLDYFVSGIGTGGTLSGCASFFKDQKLHVHVVGVEPLQSPLLSTGIAHSHRIEGIGANFIPQTLNVKMIDDIVDVDDQKSIAMAELIRDLEGIDCGYSSGAALLGALQFIQQNKIKNKKIVIIFPDKGDRYVWKK